MKTTEGMVKEKAEFVVEGNCGSLIEVHLELAKGWWLPRVLLVQDKELLEHLASLVTCRKVERPEVPSPCLVQGLLSLGALSCSCQECASLLSYALYTF